jgi:hypothetical protein
MGQCDIGLAVQLSSKKRHTTGHSLIQTVGRRYPKQLITIEQIHAAKTRLARRHYSKSWTKLAIQSLAEKIWFESQYFRKNRGQPPFTSSIAARTLPGSERNIR